MNNRMKLTVATAAAVLAGCAAHSSQHSARALNHNCSALGDVSVQVAELYTDKVAAVKPVRDKIFVARAIQPVVIIGAELYVPAEKDMSGAYLDRLMSCHAGSQVASAHPNDPLRVDGVDRIDVDEVGSNFRITVTSEDRAAGRAIWQSAQRLRDGGSVSVHQLARADAQRSAL